MEVNGRAESIVLNEIKEYIADEGNEGMFSVFGSNVFQLFAPANTVTSRPGFILIERVSDVVMDRTISDSGDMLRTVRLQINVWTKAYDTSVKYSEKLRKFLETKFPSCVENGSVGADNIGTTTWVIASIDIILTEINDEEEII